ncbi:hypothetical protein BC830DRAFT_1128212 [Chytriomyces sp. MP71]|nr:hypothetical protein BC830DRAFT_1128212 [Chytriomyces sp. MP71]
MIYRCWTYTAAQRHPLPATRAISWIFTILPLRTCQHRRPWRSWLACAAADSMHMPSTMCTLDSVFHRASLHQPDEVVMLAGSPGRMTTLGAMTEGLQVMLEIGAGIGGAKARCRRGGIQEVHWRGWKGVFTRWRVLWIRMVAHQEFIRLRRWRGLSGLNRTYCDCFITVYEIG